MASSYPGRSAAYTPELIDLSDSQEPLSEELVSISEDEPAQGVLNDHRLTQAINYLTEEGGDDSPTTFIARVDRIDEALLLQLPQQGRDFDTKLYRRARALIREVQREFEKAAQQAPSSILENEESEEDLPQYYTPSAAQALYCRPEDDFEEDVEQASSLDEEIPSEQAAPPAKKPKLTSKHVVLQAKKPEVLTKTNKEKAEVIHRERRFKYGGPDPAVENWHKDFTETIQMAHWESIKIDYDLSESRKADKASGKVVETNIPFKHIARHYQNLPLYDSGSRFKFPPLSKEDQTTIEELGTVTRLKKVVTAFNQGDRKTGLAKDYAPRMWLRELNFDEQMSQNKIRQALQTTPSKPRSPVTVQAIRTTSVTGQAPLTPPVTGTVPNARETPVTGTTTRPRLASVTSTARPQTTSTALTKTPTKQTTGVTQSETPLSIETLQKDIIEGYCTLDEVLQVNTEDQKSALSRKIEKARQLAVNNSPRRHGGISTAPGTPRETPRYPSSPNVMVPIRQKRGPGRPRKNQVPEQTVPVPESTRPTRSTTTKRKRSIGQQGYKPDPPLNKGVSWVDPDPDTEEEESIIAVRPKKVAKKATPAKIVPRKNRAAKTVAKDSLGLGHTIKGRVPLEKPSKASAAGAQVRKKKVSEREQIVDEVEYRRKLAAKRAERAGAPVTPGSTRAGRRFRKTTI